MKKILITGSSGFIGKNLIDSLLSKYEVIGLIKKKGKSKIKHITKDISEVTSKI